MCERGAEEAAQITAPNTLAQLEQVVELVAALNERLNEQTKALTPPPALEDEFRSLVSLLDDDERFLADLGEAAAARDQAAADEAVTRYEALGREEDRLWRLMGVPACTRIRLGQPST